MRILIPTIALITACAPSLAQNSLVFTGRFPFVSLDAPNERPGGAINRLEEFDFSFVTPGAGAFARSLQPATAHQAYLGDGDNDGSYTKFFGLKTYFEQLQLGGLFVKDADQAFTTADRVYFTVRDNVTQDIEAFTNNGASTVVLRPGDFVRLTGSGNLEFFITADQFNTAAGAPPAGQSSVMGASGLCQDAAGNLYYSPPQGGHWINGNQGGPVFANDGSIVMIDAANITYDAQGNVASIVADTARVLFEENNAGPGPAAVTVRQMVTNSGGFDRFGGPLVAAGVFGKVGGLDLDPNGGTIAPSYPDINGVFTPVPNFVFTSDAGSYGGTIFSTANNGSIATINGVLCGSLTSGVPADGSWLGVALDTANFQPSLMGLTVVDTIPFEPLVLDMNEFGSLDVAANAPNWDLDLHGIPGMVTFIIAQLGPGAPGTFPLSVPNAFLPVSFTPDSHPEIFVAAPPTTLGFVVTDGFGYANLSNPNPHSGAFAGISLMVQAAGLNGGQVQASNPIMMQLR